MQSFVQWRFRPWVMLFLLMFMHAGLPENAPGYQLPDTGQMKCYDGTSEIPCPKQGEAFYGQDAQYQGPPPAYQDYGDGTVMDLNTGLMWQQGDEQNSVGQGYTWQQAADYCSNLDLGGDSDWRLPTRLELLSLIDFGRSSPAVNTDYFPNCRWDYNSYWSSTTAGNDRSVWIVGFGNGRAIVKPTEAKAYVRCVRTAP